MTTVTISELRAAADEIFDHIATEMGPQVVLNVDYFWSIPSGDLFDTTREPTSLTVGQVSESLEFLRSASGKARLGYELVWIADVMRALGTQLVG